MTVDIDNASLTCASEFELVLDLGPNVSNINVTVVAGVDVSALQSGNRITLSELSNSSSLPVTGSLASVTFTLPPGKCMQPIISSVSGTDCTATECMDFTIVSSTVFCNGSSLSFTGKIRASGMANPPNSELPGITVRLKILGDPTEYVGTSSYANPSNPYIVTGIPTTQSEAIARLFVDLEASDELFDFGCGVNQTDVNMLDDFLNGIPGSELTYAQLVAADIDRSGKIDMYDLNLLDDYVNNSVPLPVTPLIYGNNSPPDSYGRSVVYITTLDYFNHPTGATFSEDALMYGYYFWGYFSQPTNFGNSPTSQLDFGAIKTGDINGDCDLYDPTMLLPPGRAAV